MPELAEVEYYRTRWNEGLGHPITRVKQHPGKRIFRSVPTRLMGRKLAGAIFQSSESRGKQMLFRFSPDLWLGLHLGMTGKLSVGEGNFVPGKHDHLVLYQDGRALVFSDPRLFGRVQFHCGPEAPEWWAKLPAPVDSPQFTMDTMRNFLAAHRRLSLKGALLLQAGFPGIGNWMADEILWRAKIKPTRRCSRLTTLEADPLWKALRFVTRGAIRSVAKDFSDPPANWLFHERWGRNGLCPIHRIPLSRGTVGGRSTVWCSECQPR